MKDQLLGLKRQELKAKIRLNSLKKAREDYWGPIGNSARNDWHQDTPFCLLRALEATAEEELKQWGQEIENFKKSQA